MTGDVKRGNEPADTGNVQPPDRMQRLDAAVRQFVRRAGWLLFARHAVIFAAGWAFAWGVATLAMRTTYDTPREMLLWGAAGFALLLLPAAWLAWRGRPGPAAVRALMDERGRCGGLLMAQDEQAMDGWRDRMPEPAAVRVQWRGGRSLSVLLLGLVFLMAGFALPINQMVPRGARALDVREPVAALTEQLELLEEHELLDEPEAEALQDKLRELLAEAAGDDPVRTLESLDHLREKLQQSAAEAAEQAVQETAELTQSQALAEALQQQGHLLDEALQAQAMKDLAAMVQQAMAENQNLRDQLGEALSNQLEGGALSKEDLARLLEGLDGRKMEIVEMMRQLEQRQLVDMQMVQMCESAGECDSQGLCEFVSMCMGEGMSAGEAMSQWQTGSGGVGRGGGPSPMTWREQASDGQDARFEAQALPPTMTAEALEQSLTVGLSAAAPQVDDQAGGDSTSGVLRSDSTDGGSAATQRVLPRHRQSVHRYFDREQE